MPQYSDASTIRSARAQYFERSGFASDGGYSDRWVQLKASGVTVLVFPNTAARVRSVKLHDIHHVLTEYDTTWTGEAEIGAWELASGCARHYAAWVLNIGAVAVGMLFASKRIWAAFRRGRSSDNLYVANFSDELLDESVGDLRRRLRLT
jgi:hypothetical protein